MNATTDKFMEIKGGTSKVTATHASSNIDSATKPANQEFNLIAIDTERVNNTVIEKIDYKPAKDSWWLSSRPVSKC